MAETQPAGYYDGLDTPGTAGGAAHNPGDLIDAIPLASGVHATDYDFGELLPASISGRVYADMNNNSSYDAGEPLLAGVTIYLLDGSGNRTVSTTTDAEGKYAFTDLKPGVYGVEEIQPAGYLEGWNQVGSAGGELNAPDEVLNVSLGSGVDGINYDFWEVEPAKISGYVFQDGPAIVVQQGDPSPDIPALRDGKLTPDDTRLSGITLVLCDGSGVPMLDSQGNPITTVTDANGYYEFDGLSSGLYSVKEDRPSGYQPGVDTVGSLGGTVINKYDQPDTGVIQSLSLVNDPTGVQGFDFSGLSSAAITSIYVDPGNAATNYNFSEVLVKTDVSNPPPTGFPPPHSCRWCRCRRRRRCRRWRPPWRCLSPDTNPRACPTPCRRSSCGRCPAVPADRAGIPGTSASSTPASPAATARAISSSNIRRTRSSIRSLGRAPTWASRNGSWPTRTARRSKRSTSACPARSP